MTAIMLVFAIAAGAIAEGRCPTTIISVPHALASASIPEKWEEHRDAFREAPCNAGLGIMLCAFSRTISRYNWLDILHGRVYSLTLSANKCR